MKKFFKFDDPMEMLLFLMMVPIVMSMWIGVGTICYVGIMAALEMMY